MNPLQTNRERILNQALRLFANRGFDAVSVNEIVEAAGITKPTLYHYFGSKRGLLDTLMSERFEELNQIVEEAAAYHGDITNTLKTLAGAYFRYANRHWRFYRFQLGLWFSPPKSEGYLAVSQFNKTQHEILEELFEQVSEDHGNMRGRQRAYAATFLGMLNTYIGLALNGRLELDDALVERAVHQFMHGIFS